MTKEEFERRVRLEMERLRVTEEAIKQLVAEGYDEKSLRETAGM